MTPAMLTREAWVSIGASRLRSFLAMLGIVIGVGSVVLLMAVGAGSQRAVEENIEKLGSNLLIVTPGSSMSGGIRTGDISQLTMEDANDISQLSSVLASAPSTFGHSFQVAAGKLNWNTQVTGTTPPYFAIRNWEFAEGEPFTGEDVNRSRRVAVIGSALAEKLFPDDTAQGYSLIGRRISINGIPFDIIGLLRAKGSGFEGRNQDDSVFIPITTAKNALWGNMYVQGIVGMIYVKAPSRAGLIAATEDITALLRQRHHLKETAADNFTINNLSAITQVATDTTRAISLLLGAIASISLVVGGIGIMNIMLVTVTERTREIGIRKAIGATASQILLQFLLEAVMIAAVGSMAGLTIGFAGGLAAKRGFGLPVEYSVWSIVLALMVAAVIGIASGLYPAWKAAKLQPIDALRSIGA